MKEKSRFDKLWPTFVLGFTFLTAVVWILTWFFGYNLKLNVFEKNLYAYICGGLGVLTGIIAILPYFRLKGKGKADLRYLTVTDKNTAAMAALCAIFIVAASYLKVYENLEMIFAFGGLAAKQKVLTASIALSAVFAIPASMYFVCIALAKDQNLKMMKIFAPFTALFFIVEVFIWYFEPARPINDPVRSLLEVLAAVCMLYTYAETRLRLVDCDCPIREYAAARTLTILSLALSGSMLADTFIVFVLNIFSSLGATISADSLTYIVNADELIFVICSFVVSIYAVNRGNGRKAQLEKRREEKRIAEAKANGEPIPESKPAEVELFLNTNTLPEDEIEELSNEFKKINENKEETKEQEN